MCYIYGSYANVLLCNNIHYTEIVGMCHVESSY
jgi:hypothetical protein